MTMDVDELGARAADAVDMAGRGVGNPPPPALLRQRWRQRQRLQLATGVVGVVAVSVLVVVAAPNLRLQAPEIGTGPTGIPASPEPSPSQPGATATSDPGGPIITAGGWTMTAAPAVFSETHGQVLAAAHLDDRTVLVGIDASRASAHTTPAVWLRDDGGEWRRVPLDHIDRGGSRYDAAGVLMTDVAASDDGTLVAIGYANFEPRQEPVVWISTDLGESWDLFEDLGGSGDLSLSAVAWGSRGFVIVGTREGFPTALWEADEGWVEGPVDGEGALVAVAPLGNGYVATSILGDSSGSFVTGPVTPGAALPEWEHVNFDAGLEVASLLGAPGGVFAAGTSRPDGVDYDGAVSRSRDGATWDPFGGGGLGGPGDQFVRDVMLAVGEEVVAVGSDRERAAIWMLSGGNWEQLPGELFPEGSSASVSVMLDGEPVVFGLIQKGDRHEVVTWQRTRSGPAGG